MIVYNDLSKFKKEKNVVITVGSFDGLHLGHQLILNKLIEISKLLNGKSLLLTFEPHPRNVVSKNFDFKILTTLEEKKILLEKFGIDILVIQNFTEEFSQKTSEEFIKEILVGKIGISHIVVGHDHKFGKDRMGDEKDLKEFGNKFNFDVTSVEAVVIDNMVVSSTKIRNALCDGDIEKANLLLGRNYTIFGKVVHGIKRGRLLGYPTANIEVFDNKKAIPKNGVYVVNVNLNNNNYSGIMNIGIRPTFENNNLRVLEVNLLNFNEDIYEENIEVSFVKRLRDEIKFQSKDELINQIKKDIDKAREILIN